MKECEKNNKIIYFNSNFCVCCGAEIPEGSMVCNYCIDKNKHSRSKSDRSRDILFSYKKF